MDTGVLILSVFALCRVAVQGWSLGNSVLVRDMYDAYLALALASQFLYLGALPFVAYKPVTKRYLLSFIVNRSFPLYALTLVLDGLNFIQSNTGAQRLYIFLLHSEMMFTVWILNTRRDRCLPLYIVPVQYTLLLIGVVKTYNSLQLDPTRNQAPEIANHAIFNMNETVYIISILIYLIQKMFDPRENILYVPRGGIDQIIDPEHAVCELDKTEQELYEEQHNSAAAAAAAGHHHPAVASVNGSAAGSGSGGSGSGSHHPGVLSDGETGPHPLIPLWSLCHSTNPARATANSIKRMNTTNAGPGACGSIRLCCCEPDLVDVADGHDDRDLLGGSSGGVPQRMMDRDQPLLAVTIASTRSVQHSPASPHQPFLQL